MIDFQKVESDTETINILYFLLKKRNHKISHQNMPNFAVHENFVKHNPYKVWYLVNLDGKAIGSFYIKFDNSVGMNLTQETKYIVNSIIELICHIHIPMKINCQPRWAIKFSIRIQTSRKQGNVVTKHFINRIPYVI